MSKQKPNISHNAEKVFNIIVDLLESEDLNYFEKKGITQELADQFSGDTYFVEVTGEDENKNDEENGEQYDG